MRLKSLELHGYKTFASRTVFEFAGAVTAIVGPNGSGKSNIADGLRWVLGEQSYSLLRGKKTEDMIFSGSEQRSRSGMASVTLVFDNEESWLPIDYSEVAIARRAYRDGQNEYLLNGQKVRLRDVSELIAQSGLAERTYTIIGQGLVDAALALKAEERRRLFEEAAGIGLFRTRREEALRRLELTHRNLDRVQDILSELEPRLRSLERQSRRAREFDQVKSELRDMLREWYGYHWQRAQLDLTTAMEGIRVKEEDLNRARAKQAKLDEELSTRRERIQAIRVNLNEWHRQLASSHSDREVIGRELAVIEERKRALEEQTQEAARVLVNIQEDVSVLQVKLNSTREECENLRIELDEAKQHLISTKEALLERQKEREAIDGEGRDLVARLETLTTRQTQSQLGQSENQSRSIRLQAELEDKVRQAQEVESKLSAAEENLREREREHEAARSSRLESEKSLSQHDDQKQAFETNRKEVINQLISRQTDAARLRVELEVIDQAEQSLVGYAQGSRLVLEAARQERLSGVRGALNKFLNVPAELEMPIAAVLGEYLDAVLLGPEADLDQALRIFENEPGRGVLLPLGSLMRESGRRASIIRKLLSSRSDQESVLGLASELVKCELDLRPAVDVLLGGILVVKDRGIARQLLADFDEMKDGPVQAGIVTLRGEVFFSNGTILAGRDNRSGVLSRGRMQREASGRLARVEVEVASYQRRVKGLERTEQELLEKREKLVEGHRNAVEKEEKCSALHRHSSLELDQLKQQLSWLFEQKERLQAEIVQGETEANRISSELTQISEEIRQTESHLQGWQAKLDQLPYEDLFSQAAQLETQVAVAEQALLDASMRETERRATLEKERSELRKIEEKLIENEALLRELTGGQAELKGRQDEVNRIIEKGQASIDPAEKDLLMLEEEQLSFQTAEGEARLGLNLAEHHYAQANIQLARCQEALETLRRRIEDDFGLVAFEYAEEISGPTPLPLEGLVEQLPAIHHLAPEQEESLKRQKMLLRKIGPINPEAQEEYLEVSERYNFLTDQLADLRKAEVDIREVIAELDALMKKQFLETFEAVAEEFHQIFTRLFAGGSARLILTDQQDLTTSGIDIEARLPGRREQGLSLLSGGERSLTAVALVFALLKISPTPFCVLDEVDAMLDEANVSRFKDLLRELSEKTQFIIITHNRNTLQVADVIYGVTMGSDSSSQIIGIKMDEFEKIEA
jgi:chromosome segregation protein